MPARDDGGARLVVAQVNPALPWTEGDTLIEPGLIDILVPAEHPVLELPARAIGPVERAIAADVARLVPDRATIELGIGLIPEAVTAALGGKRGLGIHSGAIGDGVAELMREGIVDNRHKEIDPGVTVTLMLMGTRRLYEFADRNPLIRIRSPRYTHDALVLGNFRRFVAINSALEVDLTGQVNAETAQGRNIGLTGGQMDFVRAANRAPEGRSIIALPSTSRDRRHSRIVARLAGRDRDDAARRRRLRRHRARHRRAERPHPGRTRPRDDRDRRPGVPRRTGARRRAAAVVGGGGYRRRRGRARTGAIPVGGSTCGKAAGEKLAFFLKRGDRGSERGRLLEPEGRHRDIVPVAQPGQFAIDLGEPGAARGSISSPIARPHPA